MPIRIIERDYKNGGEISMKSLILHPTSEALWQTLIFDAQKESAILLKEDLESYLVFLLMRFTAESSIASSVIGLEFLKSYQVDPKGQKQNLKAVGDKCLLLAGLFPERAIKRRVRLSYFINLGQTAYASLADNVTRQDTLYSELSHEFPKLIDVLHALREFNTSQDLFSLYEQWHETHSQVAWQRLCKATHSLPIGNTFKKSGH